MPKIFKLAADQREALTESADMANQYAGQLALEPLPTASIKLHPENPRKMSLLIEECINSTIDLSVIGIHKDDLAFEEKRRELESLIPLARSIQEHGLINPIKVYKEQGYYLLEAGERRTLACALINEKVLARISFGVPTALQLGQIQWTENVDRENLTLSERVICINATMKAYCSEANKDKNEITGKDFMKIFNFHSRTIAFNYYAIWNAEDSAVLEAIHANKLKSLKKANIILSEKDPVKRSKLLETAVMDVTLEKPEQLSGRTKKKKLSAQIQQKRVRAGRKRTKINFGASKNMKVAEILLFAGKEALEIELKEILDADIRWDDFDQISAAFERMIGLLEKKYINLG